MRSNQTQRSTARAAGAARLPRRRRDQDLVERAAELERRNVTDFCLAALVDAARETISRHETLVLSERDREVFFDTLVNPPEINPRLRRAFEAERLHVEP